MCVQYSMDKESLVVQVCTRKEGREGGHSLRCVCVCVVQASSEESMHKASLLIDMHLRDLRTQKQLMDRAGAVAQRVSPSFCHLLIYL